VLKPQANGGAGVTAPPDGYEPVTVPELHGAAGPVRVTLLGAPALRSTRTGGRRPVEALRAADGEGGWEALSPASFLRVRAMFACGSHVMKLKEHLPRLIFLCPGCGGRLPDGPADRHRFEFDAEPLDPPAFRVVLDAPAVGCPGCGRFNVPWSDETAALVEAALAEAVGAARTDGRDPA
jgi:hypothetical protein